jgi:aldose 1-epimerase
MQYVFRGRRGLVFAPLVVAVALVALVLGGSASASSARRHHHRGVGGGGLNISSEPWGTADGQAVSLYTLSNAHKMKVRISNYGGIVQSILAPGRGGRVADVALGFPDLAGYVQNDAYPQPTGGSGTTYFGAIVGRYANRIANGQFSLDGQTYTLPQNNGTNTLHGGPNAMNSKVWTATEVHGADSVSLKLAYTDPDGYNGFPGAVTILVTYTLTNSNALRIHYTATTTKPTVVNFTNHTYFNLAGEGSGDVMSQLLKLNADTYTPINSNLIPTGAIVPVSGTPLDFRTLTPIGRHLRDNFDQLLLAHGYDFNWVLNGSGMRQAAVAEDPASGRTLTTYTDQPGIQFYSGNFLVGDLVGPSGHIYRQTDGFTLETQHFPNSPNQPNFPSTTLNPGQTFNSTTIYKFGVANRR